MKKYSNIVPEGTKDFLFEECDARRKIEVTLSGLFKEKNYRKVITPNFEFFDVFDRESAGMPLENMYKMTDVHGRLLVLRPDNTMPIARVVATRLSGEMFPIRLYYTQSVFTQNPSLTGRNDEIAQSGIELIGAKGKRADLEVVNTAYEALERCGAPDFRIEIGHAGFFNAILDKMQLNDTVRDDISKLIEAKNYAALNDLLDEIGDNEETRAIKRMPRLFGGVEVLQQAALLYHGKKANEALDYLHTLYRDLCSIGLKHHIAIDLGIVNRSNYYTGIVFRGYIEGSGITVLSGGRYDNLIGEFGFDAAAIGFGVDVNALSQALYQRGESLRPPTPERLVFGADGCEVDAMVHSNNLYGLNLKNEVFVGSSIEEATVYALKQGIRFIDYVEKGKITTLEIAEESVCGQSELH